MPRTNQFFDNLSDTPILSEREAIDVLEEYCGENNIPIWSLPNSIISDFIQTVRYAPHEIDTDEIARRTGVDFHRRVSDSSPSITPYEFYTSLPNRPRIQQPVQVQATPRNGVGVSLQGMNSNTISNANRNHVNFAELLEQATENILTAQVSPVMIDSVEDRIAVRDTDEDDDFYTWTTASITPKKKKRKRSEYDMVKELVRGDSFPRPNSRDWSSHSEYEEVVHDWYSNVEYREQWIFSRREREGFNRRNIGFFSLDDVMARMSKRRKPHHLDTETSKFYDWKLGGTDWILRLELYQHEQYYFLITRHIHKPTETEIKFDVRYWSNDRFKEINSVWCQQKNNDIQFERVFGSNDENSSYYVRPYVEDEDDYYDEDYDEDYDNDEEYEGSTF